MNERNRKGFIETLKKAYFAENLLADSLSKIDSIQLNESLKEKLEAYRECIRSQVDRLDQIFQNIRVNPGGMRSDKVSMHIEKINKLIQSQKDIPNKELLSPVIKVEHVKIATYVALINLPNKKDFNNMISIHNILSESLEEEAKAYEEIKDFL